MSSIGESVYRIDWWDKQTTISDLIHYTVFHGIFMGFSFNLQMDTFTNI